MRLHYTERARIDLEIAFQWYEDQRIGLGYDFLDSVEVSIKNILEYPEMYENVYANFRRCVIRRFPFSIFYTIEGSTLIVHSFFDNRQDPPKRP